MLSQLDNDFVTQTDAGTPVGDLMREYWIPAMLSSELPAPDSDPVRVLLLGERLIAYRDSSGQVGLISNLCPHRGASLFFGRNEEGGIRCVYHGWKFDVAGHCVEMPNEPASSNFKDRIRATAYPCVERAGVVWAYLGSREQPPALPSLEVLELPDEELAVTAVMRDCNWLQAIEGDIDTSHVSFLHAGAIQPDDVEPGTERYYQLLHRDPQFVAVDTDFGAMYGAFRPGGPGKLYWRIAQFMFPFYAQTPRDVDAPIASKAVVPMDDTHCMVINIRQRGRGRNDGRSAIVARTGRPQIEEAQMVEKNGTGWYDRFRLVAQLDNDFLIDREAQRSRVSYTGIKGGLAQDQAITESMGPVLDRSIEHLGSADLMILRTRNRIMDVARALAENKIVPPGVDDPTVYLTRACALTLPEGVDWLEATEEYRASRTSAS